MKIRRTAEFAPVCGACGIRIKFYGQQEAIFKSLTVLVCAMKEISAMRADFVDHGLPLVSLKEHRRELIIAMIGRTEPLSGSEIQEIAAVQQAIAAIEAVIEDLDAEPTHCGDAPILFAAH